MTDVRVHKQKYRGRPHLTSRLQVWCTDEFGTWLYRPRTGLADRVGVQLMPTGHWWTAWWWIGWDGNPTRRWIAVDICTPPTLDVEGWRYDDLEIDLVRQADGSVLILDEDEFDAARRTVPYPPVIAAGALVARDEVHRMLTEPCEPFRSVGWQRLDSARADA